MYFPKLENVSRIPVAERRTFPGDHVQHHADCHKANAGNDLPREMFFLAVLRHFHTFRTLFHRCICHCRSPRFMYFTLLSQHACLPDLLSAYLQIILSHKSCRGEQRSLVLVAYMVCINSNLVAPKTGRRGRRPLHLPRRKIAPLGIYSIKVTCSVGYANSSLLT